MDIEITLKEVNGKQIPAVTSLQVAEAFASATLWPTSWARGSTGSR